MLSSCRGGKCLFRFYCSDQQQFLEKVSEYLENKASPKLKVFRCEVTS